MKEIRLTRGKVAFVDDSDYVAISKHKWYVRPDSTRHDCWYAARRIVRDGKITSIAMHNDIINPPDGFNVDHEDGNGLNNCRSNLRLFPVNQFHNIANSRLRRDSKSGFKGVTWHGQSRKWRAGLRIDGHYKSYGLYADPKEAAKAYDAAAIQEFGSFARTNQMLRLIPA